MQLWRVRTGFQPVHYCSTIILTHIRPPPANTSCSSPVCSTQSRSCSATHRHPLWPALSPSPPPCNLSTPAPLHSGDGAAVAAATISVAGADSLLRSVQLSYTTSGGGSNRQKRGAVSRLTPASHTNKSPVKKFTRTTRCGAPLRRTRGGGVSVFDPVADGPSPPSVVPPSTDMPTTRRRMATATTPANASDCLGALCLKLEEAL